MLFAGFFLNFLLFLLYVRCRATESSIPGSAYDVPLHTVGWLLAFSPPFLSLLHSFLQPNSSPEWDIFTLHLILETPGYCLVSNSIHPEKADFLLLVEGAGLGLWCSRNKL